MTNGRNYQEEVLELLMSANMTVGQVARALGVSRPTAYKYVRALEQEGLLDRYRARVEVHGPWPVVYAADRYGFDSGGGA